MHIIIDPRTNLYLTHLSLLIISYDYQMALIILTDKS